MICSQHKAQCVWLWEAVDQDQSFAHPSSLQSLQRACGPFWAKITKATCILFSQYTALLLRGSDVLEVPKGMLLPHAEGLLLLQQMNSLSKVPWFNDDLRQLLKKNSSLRPADYLERVLLTVAVTSTNYVAEITGLHRRPFRPRRLKVEEGMKDVENQEEGMWTAKDVVGFLPPWEAFCNQRCGLYQDFYLVLWDDPKKEGKEWSSVENGCEEVPQATWEADECLPEHLDHLRFRCKVDWVARQRVKEKMAEVERLQKESKKRRRSQTPQREAASKTPKTPQRDPGPPGTQRQELGKSPGTQKLTPRWHPNGYWMTPPGAFGTQQEELTIREKVIDQPAKSNGFMVGTEFVHKLMPIECEDKLQPETARKNKELDKDERRVNQVDQAIENFKKQRHVVKVHDNKEFRGNWPHLNLMPSRSPPGTLERVKQLNEQREHIRTMALMIEEHLRTALMFLPLSLGAGFQLPALGCLSKLSHRPDFEAGDPWPPGLTISQDGWLMGPEAQLEKEVFFSIQQIYDDGCHVSVDCALRDLGTNHWTWTTRLVVLSLKHMVSKDLGSEELWQRLLVPLGHLYDLDAEEPKDLPIAEWMSSMTQLLQMLRALSMVQRFW